MERRRNVVFQSVIWGFTIQGTVAAWCGQLLMSLSREETLIILLLVKLDAKVSWKQFSAIKDGAKRIFSFANL